MSEFPSWRSYHKFASSVKRERRYIHTAEAKHFLGALLETSKDKHIVLGKGEKLYRSQRGYDEKEQYDKDGTTQIGIESLPYGPDRMIPKAENSRNGRANPAGIPCLYLSGDPKTAVAETRPWIKERISVAEFWVIRDLKIIDFTGGEPLSSFHWEEPEDAKVREKAAWESVNRAFSEPVNIEDQDQDYVPTQIISELFKGEGFDGIKYRSMLTSGSNFALFNLRDANLNSGVVVEIKGIEYQFDQCSNPVKHSL